MVNRARKHKEETRGGTGRLKEDGTGVAKEGKDERREEKTKMNSDQNENTGEERREGDASGCGGERRSRATERTAAKRAECGKRWRLRRQGERAGGEGGLGRVRADRRR